MKRSAICCKSTDGRRLEGGAAGEREGCGFREAASQGGPIGHRPPISPRAECVSNWGLELHFPQLCGVNSNSSNSINWFSLFRQNWL